MLKHRLLFGTLMTILFASLMIFDGWLDGSLTDSALDDMGVQGTVLCILIVLLVIPAQIEFSGLANLKNIKIFKPVSITASILFATSWYWLQLLTFSLEFYLLYLSVFSLLALFLYQYLYYGTSGVITNCGANYLSIIYLGLLSSFVLGVRLDFGLWAFLMFVFVIKCSDIGAYTIGKLFGKHKFSPKISPGKTWEGMAGAIGFAVIVAVLFAKIFDIMGLLHAVVFGACFAFIGQCGDLAESMLKRDAEQKDSVSPNSVGVPGFGGLLDVIDSPVAAAPFAYMFFLLAVN
ncbi:MAG: phosphatidate cytidylyltransferase [Planctomycetota bacterium]|jgi:phosphatidate cytidylyltransferase